MCFSVPSRIENWKDHFFEPKVVDKCLWSHETRVEVFCQTQSSDLWERRKVIFPNNCTIRGQFDKSHPGQVADTLLYYVDPIGYAFFVVSQLNSHQVSGRGSFLPVSGHWQPDTARGWGSQLKSHKILGRHTVWYHGCIAHQYIHSTSVQSK